MTSIAHTSGTDRIAEVAGQLAWDKNTLVVNVQGDEPEIDIDDIKSLYNKVKVHRSQIGTLAAKISNLNIYCLLYTSPSPRD